MKNLLLAACIASLFALGCKPPTLFTFLLDKSGNAIAEEDYTAIAPNSFLDDQQQPLKPNYSRKIGFKINPPSDWSKNFKLSVVDVTTTE